MSISEAFGLILRQARQDKGLTQERLGELSGLHRTYISLLERGQRTPTLDVLFRLAGSLGVSASDMVKGLE
ncbi:MAG: helix-turn-helix transcriptional regulator [Phycisphaerales bacterium]|jgi:transcriptional regulator with XRE-family HTH domain|nr:helix-turn-helix transcriptional regulator [Phycisphaerales bacterium]